MVIRSLPLPDCHWWTWRRSAQFRALSLVSAWLLIMGAGLLGPLLWPLAAVRFAGSTVQTVLNIRLGKRIPVDSATRTDWVLVAGMLLASCAISTAYRAGVNLGDAWMVVPLLIPFTVLQVRMGRRALAADAAIDVHAAEIDRLQRVAGRQRLRLLPANAEQDLRQAA